MADYDSVAGGFRPGLYKHHKGGLYRALFVAVHHETNQQFVVYVPLEYPESGVRVRELDDWFADVNPNDLQVIYTPRFAWVGP